MSLLSKVREQYFSDKNYSLLYVHRFCFGVSYSIFKVFAGAYLFYHGLPLPLVLLYYGLEFGLRGFFCPFGYKLTSKIGAPYAFLCSVFFQMLFLFFTAQAEHSIAIGFFAFIFQSIRGGIYYSFADVLEAVGIKEDRNRGKQYTLSLIGTSLAVALGAGVSGFILDQFSFHSLVVFGCGFDLICAIPLFLLSGLKKPGDCSVREVYKFIASPEFRPYMLSFLGEQLGIIMQIIIPFYIFTLVGKFNVLGYFIVVATLVEIVVLLIFGRHIDQSGNENALRKSFFLTSLSSLGYIFIVNSPVTAFFVESYNRIAWKTYNSAYRTAVHKKINKQFPNLVLFGTAFQMTLCYGEVIVLGLLALLAYYLGNNIFILVFLFSIIGIFYSIRRSEKW